MIGTYDLIVALLSVVLSLGTALLVGWTGFLGGQIRHSELRAGTPASEPAGDAERDKGERD